MTPTTKPRVVKDYDKLDPLIQEQIKLTYPNGFSNFLIKFKNKEGNMVSALPFEAEEKYYLVRMTVTEARAIIENDDDYDDMGYLKDDVKEEYEEKYSDLEDLGEDVVDPSTEDDDV